jgi:hypothetical protein
MATEPVWRHPPLDQIVVGHVDQLQAVPQARGAQHKGGCGELAGRRKNWGGGVIALARGINGTRASSCTMCIVLVRAPGQAGHPGWGAWVLLRVRRKIVPAQLLA